jgi:hypothetical protein
VSRCQHCGKLTHSQHVYVSYKKEDADKIYELSQLEKWTPQWQYTSDELYESSPNEYGKLKCGDIYVHFVMEIEQSEVK